MTVPGDALLKHGYTLAKLEEIARQVARSRYHRSNRVDAYDIAYGAVAEALYKADEAPTERDLVQAGDAAIEEHVRLEMKAHGRHHTRGLSSRYVAYWDGQRITHFPDDRIVDRMAVVQILPLLTPRQCEVLVAYTAGGSLAAVADALGISTRTASRHLCAARETFQQWWHEHETPVTYDSATTCDNGHLWAENEVTWAGRRYCRPCHQTSRRRGYWNDKGKAAA